MYQAVDAAAKAAPIASAKLCAMILTTMKKFFRSNRALCLALLFVVAGCSTNAGFGTPAQGPNPISNPYGPQPGPTVSGSVMPFEERPGLQPIGTPYGSPSPTPTPIPNTISIVGAALRLAYDGSAKDPVKAQRLLELSFALQNTTKNSAKVTSVAAYADKTALGASPVLVTAASGQTSEVAAVALKTSDDPMKYKQVMVNFLDDTKKMIGSANLDVPPLDTSFTSLDDKHPKGPFSIDSAEISSIRIGRGPSFECTCAVTNATSAAVSVTQFEITPPKGDPVKLAIPLAVPPRSVSGFVSVVVPFTGGKTLPSGSYTIRAVQNGSTAAKTSAVLL
jgi:hypothetical protein